MTKRLNVSDRQFVLVAGFKIDSGGGCLYQSCLSGNAKTLRITRADRCYVMQWNVCLIIHNRLTEACPQSIPQTATAKPQQVCSTLTLTAAQLLPVSSLPVSLVRDTKPITPRNKTNSALWTSSFDGLISKPGTIPWLKIVTLLDCTLCG